jgi:hypothetical protein
MDTISMAVDEGLIGCCANSEPVGRAVESVESTLISSGIVDYAVIGGETDEELGGDDADGIVEGGQIDLGAHFGKKYSGRAASVNGSVLNWHELAGGVEGVIDDSTLSIVIGDESQVCIDFDEIEGGVLEYVALDIDEVGASQEFADVIKLLIVADGSGIGKWAFLLMLIANERSLLPISGVTSGYT